MGDEENHSYMMPVNFGNDDKEDRRRCCTAHRTYVVIFVILGALTLASCGLSAYILAYKIIPEKGHIQKMERQMQYEMSESKWGNYSAEVAHYEEKVVKLKRAILATVDVMHRYQKDTMAAQAEMKGTIKEVKENFTKNLPGISNNKASIGRQSARISDLERKVSRHQLDVSTYKKEFAAKLKDLESQVASEHAGHIENVKDMMKSREGLALLYKSLKSQVDEIRSKQDTIVRKQERRANQVQSTGSRAGVNTLVLICAGLLVSTIY